MPVYTNINGIWREAWTTSVNINGAWRDAEVKPMINGVYRDVNKINVDESDIIGFRFVYKLNKEKSYPLLPDLKYNPRLPIKMELTGNGINMMTNEYKGVIFEYFNTREPMEEGICVYDLHLYAVLLNDVLLDVTQVKSVSGNEERVDPKIPGITEVWYTNKIESLNIQIQAILKYECSGYNFCGWNNLFSTTNCVCTHDFPIREYRGQLPINSFNILPIDSRDETFKPIGEIGIARSMHDEELNMVGSYGNVDQTIDWITVNGVQKPFVVEIYN